MALPNTAVSMDLTPASNFNFGISKITNVVPGHPPALLTAVTERSWGQVKACD